MISILDTRDIGGITDREEMVKELSILLYNLGMKVIIICFHLSIGFDTSENRHSLVKSIAYKCKKN